LQPMGAPDALDRTDADAGRLGHGHARPVRGLARRRCKGQSDDALGDRGSSLEMREGRVMSRRRALEALAAKRSWQRQTQVLDLQAPRMIALAPPSAVCSTICARQTCFCDALRSLTTARSRALSINVTEREMPLRIRQTRTPRAPKPDSNVRFDPLAR
jgi:hypothetical protein